MAQHRIKESDEQLHWFWRITTKWWFFLVFYLLLALILGILNVLFPPEPSMSEQVLNENFMIILSNILFASMFNIIALHIGIGIFFDKLFGNSNAAYWIATILTYIFYPFIIISTIFIIYFRYKKDKILKWLIIALLLTLISSFSGCIMFGLERRGLI